MSPTTLPTKFLRLALQPLPSTTLPVEKPQVAYFCAEYGLAAGLPFFAGGLGILAGDVVKQAADEGFPMVGVGLFYHGKRDRQIVGPDGWQHHVDYHFDPQQQGFSEVRVNGTPWTCELQFGEETIHVFALAKELSPTVTVYFLETDRPVNDPHIRELTSAPYWGDQSQQLKQQFVLGCAGVRLLEDLDLMPEVFHLNEGRPALLVWELAIWLKQKHGIDGCDALKQAKEMLVYTNHTLVRAGNVTYPWDLVEHHAQYWAEKLEMPTTALLECGLANGSESFEVTEFGLAMSRLASGVSERHTALCADQWPEFNWVNITNGVHMPTWQHPRLAQPNLSNAELWGAHRYAKRQLMKEAQRRTGIGYDPDRLVLGWARRMTHYKRLDSLFVDIERLQRIMKSSDRPVQLIVAGKAHPGDDAGKKMLQEVIHIFQNELSGCALFVPNYDIALSQHLVSGVDVWVNTPIDGREACGTSGMKAAANGVLQATVADGWAAEIDWTGIDWTLEPEHPGIHLMDLLESEIIPLFWDRNYEGVPEAWVERMRATQKIAKNFSAARMLREYQELLYSTDES